MSLDKTMDMPAAAATARTLRTSPRARRSAAGSPLPGTGWSYPKTVQLKDTTWYTSLHAPHIIDPYFLLVYTETSGRRPVSPVDRRGRSGWYGSDRLRGSIYVDAHASRGPAAASSGMNSFERSASDSGTSRIGSGYGLARSGGVVEPFGDNLGVVLEAPSFGHHDPSVDGSRLDRVHLGPPARVNTVSRCQIP
jgi:hypothetical protein